MTLDGIKTALLACGSNAIYTLPDTLFGSATLRTAFDQGLPDGQLVVTGGQLSESGTAVTLSGGGQGVFAGMSVVAVFTPAGDDVLLVATGTSTGDGSWSFGSAFPSTSKGCLGDLAATAGATLVLRTIAEGGAAGLSFQGGVTVGGVLLDAAKLIGDVPSLTFAGPITFSHGSPGFALAAPVAGTFSLGPLRDLGLTMVLQAVPPTGGPADAAGASDAILARTVVAVTVNGASARLPASIAFGGSPVTLEVGASSGSGVTVADLSTFALGGDLAALMPPAAVYDMADALQLDTIAFSITPSIPALDSVTFDLSATSDWIIGSLFTVADVTASLVVPATDPGGTSGTIRGTLQIGKPNDIVCSLAADAALPEGTFTATLDPAGPKPDVSALVTAVAGDCGLPAISVSSLDVSLDPRTSDYSLTAGFATDWVLGVGDFSLSVTGATVALADANGTPSGSVKGTLVLDRNNRLALSYAIPGGFALFAQVPSISLSALVGALCKARGTPPPDFSFDFTDSTILITENDGAFVFSFGTQLDEYGSAAVVVRHTGAGWGFVFGILLDTVKLAGLPGLSVLSAIDDAFGLEEIVVVFGTMTETSFAFPALSDFGNASIKAPEIASPAWDGSLVAGLNIYARLDPAKSEALGDLCKLVGFDGTAAAALQIPTDPADMSLTASLSGPINSQTTLTGALIVKLVGGSPVLALAGSIRTSIDGSPVTFTVEVAFEATGVFVSGTALGTITFERVSLGGLALEMGVDAAGIPSFGFAAEIMVEDFDSSIAVFANSANPAQSLFAGSISDVTLDQVLGPIIGVADKDVSSDVSGFLEQIELSGTSTFTLASSAAAALNARDQAGVIAAFAAAGLTLSGAGGAVSVLGTSATGPWAVTDLSTLTHYHLTLAGDGSVAGKKQAQVTFVPQTTQIGSLPPVQGPCFSMAGAIDVFGITGTAVIVIVPGAGLLLQASMSPVRFLNGSLLTITDDAADGQGPFLDVCSYTKDGVGPHARASGKVTLLGLVGTGIEIDISSAGGTFALASQNPAYRYNIGVTLNRNGFDASGTASVGLDQSLDLGTLGTVSIDATVGGTVTVSLTGTAAAASFSGSFTFQGDSLQTGPCALSVTEASLQNLGQQILGVVTQAIKNDLLADLDPTKWLNWVDTDVIAGMRSDAAQVGQVLGGTFHQTADQIASETRNVLGYGADAAAAALKAANFTADAASRALAQARYTADDIASAIKDVFTDVHADTSVHIDVSGSSLHVDTGGLHADTAAGPHGDVAIQAHIDTAPHADTPGGPHGDTAVPPHVDGSRWGLHLDTPAGPHVDGAVPPHGDATSPHVDTPAVPHADGPVPPHGDVTPHIDQQVPHIDTSGQHIDVQT